MNSKYGLMILLVLGILLLSGCTEKNPSYAQPTEDENDIVNSVQEISDAEKQAEILNTATHARVMTMSKNWDADAENDGIAIFPTLLDPNEETVKFENVELPVDIEIYTREYENWKTIKGRLVYSGSGTISNWETGNFIMGAGIRVPFDDIKTTISDKEYGILNIVIHLPEDKEIEAEEDMARIKLG